MDSHGLRRGLVSFALRAEELRKRRTDRPGGPEQRDVHIVMYTVRMKLTATEFRKNLFTVLERVVEGETVEIGYKGSSVRITSSSFTSKLARAKRRRALLCDPDAIVHSDKKLLTEMEAEWRKDWKKL